MYPSIFAALSTLLPNLLSEKTFLNREAEMARIDGYSVINECRNSQPYKIYIPGKKMCVWTNTEVGADGGCPKYNFHTHYINEGVHGCSHGNGMVACVCDEHTLNCFDSLDNSTINTLTLQELRCILWRWEKEKPRIRRQAENETSSKDSTSSTSISTSTRATTAAKTETTTTKEKTTTSTTEEKTTTTTEKETSTTKKETTTDKQSTTTEKETTKITTTELTIGNSTSKTHSTTTTATTRREIKTVKPTQKTKKVTSTRKTLPTTVEEDRVGATSARPRFVYKNVTAHMLSVIGAYAGTLLLLQVIVLLMWQKLQRREDIFVVREMAKEISRRKK
ncbi:hypothetical protein RB195_015560 [Necator americanus]|uniref:Uncharacterized protein n=1 Tax=Necator americanus TaxID=51031 RepID=A0ABR1E7T6_NECAM